MVKVPPPIWLFLFLALAGLASAIYPWKSIVDLTLMPLGIALTIAGFLLSLWGRLIFAAEKTEVMPTSPTNTKLVTRGAFAVTRNPMYLGILVFTLGIALWAGSLPMFAVPVLMFVVCNQIHIPFEEAKMRLQFGDAYDAYAARVRRWI
ncbi:MAG TPA: isoprenylcysteine carboxylmethyltransferase family protein [Rhizomicrobium sp.]|nr:isoprenylcysteine carboxylmethyltransferase family protein [Rhizomicrobium sp.]